MPDLRKKKESATASYTYMTRARAMKNQRSEFITPNCTPRPEQNPTDGYRHLKQLVRRPHSQGEHGTKRLPAAFAAHISSLAGRRSARLPIRPPMYTGEEAPAGGYRHPLATRGGHTQRLSGQPCCSVAAVDIELRQHTRMR